ncbi:MAG TPA: hypothetical protein VF576_09205 [Rubricoccaceae bacterium]|jgi:hypothetical protein
MSKALKLPDPKSLERKAMWATMSDQTRTRIRALTNVLKGAAARGERCVTVTFAYQDAPTVINYVKTFGYQATTSRANHVGELLTAQDVITITF